MSLRCWRRGVGLGACLLALAAAGTSFAQGPHREQGQDHKSFDRQLYHTLTSTHNYGANLYNTGDWAGCFRLFEGSLMTLRPLLAHHPELQKSVSDALDQARADPSMVNRAWTLRKTMLEVRKVLASDKSSADKHEGEARHQETTEPPKTQPEKHAGANKTLWDRLGGQKGVSRIIEDTVATAARDPRVNFFRGGKYKLDAAGIKRLEEHMLQHASAMTGGPLHYQGENMKQAHKGMGITDSEFDAFMGHVKDALEKNKVSPTDANAVLTALASKRKDIVEKKKPEEKKPTGKPEEKKSGDKKADPFAPRTDNKPSTDKPVDKKPKDPFAPRTVKKPADVKPGQQSRLTGNVSLGDKPIAKGEIEFSPDKGKSSKTAIEDGAFSLDLPPGEYKVIIKADRPVIPARYSDRNTSGLRVNIKAGKQNQDLQLNP